MLGVALYDRILFRFPLRFSAPEGPNSFTEFKLHIPVLKYDIRTLQECCVNIWFLANDGFPYLAAIYLAIIGYLFSSAAPQGQTSGVVGTDQEVDLQCNVHSGLYCSFHLSL